MITTEIIHILLMNTCISINSKNKKQKQTTIVNGQVNVIDRCLWTNRKSNQRTISSRCSLFLLAHYLDEILANSGSLTRTMKWNGNATIQVVIFGTRDACYPLSLSHYCLAYELMTAIVSETENVVSLRHRMQNYSSHLQFRLTSKRKCPWDYYHDRMKNYLCLCLISIILNFADSYSYFLFKWCWAQTIREWIESDDSEIINNTLKADVCAIKSKTIKENKN